VFAQNKMDSITKSISELLVRIDANSRIIETAAQTIRFYTAENSKLQAEIKNILNDLKPKPVEILIEFDNQKRTIYCFGKTIKFGKKAFLFLQTIYNGENHSADLDEITEAVWGQKKKDGKIYKKNIWTPEGKKRIKLAKMIPNNVISVVRCQINSKFNEQDVPLEIKSEKIQIFLTLIKLMGYN
jgi:DNA-binding response OmpR family regulator